jgi:hypothetical protein
MKKRNRNAPPATPASRNVHFELLAPEAGNVFITGSFNDWRTTDLP